MKVIFLDIDGVLINRESLTQGSGNNSKAHPDCVAALNRIIEETNAAIVISSTWRISGVRKMREHLEKWGVKGAVIDVTPDLTRNTSSRISLAVERGHEIQQWLDTYGLWRNVESFVILDDGNDMAHLKDKLVQTDFESGLQLKDVGKAIEILNSFVLAKW